MQTRLRAVLEAGQKEYGLVSKQQPPSATTGKHLYTSNVPVVHAALLLGVIDEHGAATVSRDDITMRIEYTLSHQYPNGEPRISDTELTNVVNALIGKAAIKQKNVYMNLKRLPNFDLKEVFNHQNWDPTDVKNLSKRLRDRLEDQCKDERGPVVYLK